MILPDSGTTGPATTQVPRVTRRAEVRYPTVTWSELTHKALDRIRLGAISVSSDPADGLAVLILGLPIPSDCDTALAVSSLLLADHAIYADEFDAAGNTPVLLTPLGSGVWERWQDEHPGGSL